MATAVAYDGWEDVGLALTDEELDQYDPQQVAADAVERLLIGVVLCARVRQLGPTKPGVWSKMQAKMIDCATWHCLVGELPGLDREHVADLPDPHSAEGKALTVKAHGWMSTGAGGILDGWAAQVIADLRSSVTIGRRKVSSRRPSKSERSKMNKVANALTRELAAVDKLRVLEQSTSGSALIEEG